MAINQRLWAAVIGIAVAVALGGAVAIATLRDPNPSAAPVAMGDTPTSRDALVALAGGIYRRGDDELPCAAPEHEVRVGHFSIATFEVTNREFAQFVSVTKYRTTAEQRGWALVFDPQVHRWVRSEGACWRRPAGSDSSLIGRDAYPVVQVSWNDARAYARWARRRLPTEAEWEFAARGGQRDAMYPWGREERPRGVYRGNCWQGWFPDCDLAADGFAGLAPVGSFPRTGAGIADLGGNVWEWCADSFDERLYRQLAGGVDPVETPRVMGDGVDDPTARRVVRGGSWTSAENFLPGYRVAFRRGLAPDDAYQDVGFRCAADISEVAARENDLSR